MASNGADRVPSPTKGIGSLARKQPDVTPGGKAKMKFTPTLPVRRKKTDNESTKPEAAVAESSTSRGRGRGRGVGRGNAPREPAPMTASGPFALGPSMVGPARRSALRSEAGRVGAGATASPGETKGGTDQVKAETRGKSTGPKQEENEEVYSDPEDGVEIIDIEQIMNLDWMAPDVLRKTPQHSKSVKPDVKVEDVDLANAINLSDDENEEHAEDLVEHFSHQDAPMDTGEGSQHEKIYFFQLPSCFPNLEEPAPSTDGIEVVASPETPHKQDKGKGVDRSTERAKRVSFASDTKPLIDVDGDVEMVKEEESVKTLASRGRIGQLEVYDNGTVKMRIGDVVMDVTAGAPSSFHQQAVYLVPVKKRMVALGAISKRFTVSPDIDMLLEEVKKKDRAKKDGVMS